MSQKQRTLKGPVSLKGKGLHTGVEAEITFLPAPENHGYKFQRIDLDNKPIVHAYADLVVETSRGTVLEEKGVKVHTIEHAMAALNGLQIDNVLILLTGPEVPILDGSAKFYVEAIQKVGIIEQEADREYYVIKEKITFKDEVKGIEIIVYPEDKFAVDVLIDYNSKILGNQYATLENIDNFDKDIAPNRTFVFLREVENLYKHGLIKGGDMQNAIVIMENAQPQEELDRLADLFHVPHIKARPEGYLNNVELRFSNEPARHKLLDMVGDIALVGKPIKGRIIATRPGHYANTELAKIIRKKMKKDQSKSAPPVYDPNAAPLYDVNEIMKRIPHRYPFLLVDKITFMDEWKVCGIKNVTMNEAFFVGHFPDEPVMPGVLQIEAMAQVGAILLMSFVPDPENYLVYFMKIDNVKFKRKVVPGDTLNVRMILREPIKRGIAVCHGEGFVGDTLAIEVEFMAQMAKKPETNGK